MIYYAGYQLDSAPVVSPKVIPPVVIRGYDKAGNLLAAIRTSQYSDFEKLPPASGLEDVYDFYFPGYLADGTAATGVSRNQSTAPFWRPSCCAVNRDGWIFAPTLPADFYTISAGVYTTGVIDFIRVFRRNGDRVSFPDLHGALILAVAIDDSDNIYVGGWESGANRYNLRKYSKDGTLIWSRSGAARSPSPQIIEIIHISSDGSVYVAGKATYNTALLTASYFERKWIAKYDSDGNEIWSITFPTLGLIRSVTTGGGSVYISGDNFQGWIPFTGNAVNNFLGDGYVRYFNEARDNALIVKLDEDDGSVLGFYGNYPASVTPAVKSLAAQYGYFDGVLYGARDYLLNDDHDYFVHDATDLSLIYSEQLAHKQKTGLINSIAVDPDDGVMYFGGRRIVYLPSQANWLYHFYTLGIDRSGIWETLSATNAHGVDQYGVQLDSSEYYSQTYITPYGVTAGPDLGTATFGTSFGQFWSSASVYIRHDSGKPSLHFPIDFGSVDWVGDRYISVDGLPLHVLLSPLLVWREYSGALKLATIYRCYLDDLEIPVSSISLRRNLSLDSLSVVAAVSASLIAEVLARDGGVLRVDRGVRFLDGFEQMETMILTAHMTSDLRRGARSASMTLTGTATRRAINPRPRTLRGISYRATTANQVRIRCEPDTYLQPGDTATIGAESIIVEESVYTISASSAIMEIVGS